MAARLRLRTGQQNVSSYLLLPYSYRVQFLNLAAVGYNFQKWTLAECQDIIGKLQFEFEVCGGCTSRKCWNRLSLEEAEGSPEEGDLSPGERSGAFEMSPTRAAALFEKMF